VPAPRTSQSDAAGALIAVAPLVSRWVERLLAQNDPAMTVSQFLSLRAIARERLTAAELARRTGVSGPAVSQLLSSLSELGMIERHANPDDRRHQTLALTASGTRTYRAAEARLRRIVGSLLEGVPHPETDALGRLLPHVEAALAGTPPPRRPPRPPKPPPPGRVPHS
jgi:DNA-binding MarR family transcriptional regulator